MIHYPERLLGVDDRLVAIVRAVNLDLAVLCGHRDQEAQHLAFVEKRSKVDWPNSRHNEWPSQALDICPYPINWENLRAFIFLAGAMQQEARRQGVAILRWGGDFSMDGIGDKKDDQFQDLGHYELIGQTKETSCLPL